MSDEHKRLLEASLAGIADSLAVENRKAEELWAKATARDGDIDELIRQFNRAVANVEALRVQAVAIIDQARSTLTETRGSTRRAINAYQQTEALAKKVATNPRTRRLERDENGLIARAVTSDGLIQEFVRDHTGHVVDIKEYPA